MVYSIVLNSCVSLSHLLAKKAMAEKWSESDTRLSKREFREFVNAVADLMPGEDALDYFVEFLTSCVEVRILTLLHRDLL